MKCLPSLLGLAALAASTDLVAADEAHATLSLGLGKAFTFFFLTLGPAAVIAPFARATAGLDGKHRRRAAYVTTGVALFAVLVAATIGVRVLSSWGISTGALLIAAGIILFLVALQSISSQYDVTEEQSETPPETPSGQPSLRRLAFRLAFPYIVSPYGIAVVILVWTTRPDSVPVTPILAMLGGIMAINTLVMLVAHRIAGSPYLAPVMIVVKSVLAVLQAALGVHAILVGLRLAGVT